MVWQMHTNSMASEFMEKQEEQYLVDHVFTELDRKTEQEIERLELHGSRWIKFIIELWKKARGDK